MKTILYSLLGIFLLQTSVAQTTYRIKKQFFLGIFASPDLSWSTNKVLNEGFQFVENYQSNYNIPKISYTAGLEVLYQLNEKWSLTMGVQFSDKGGKTKKIDYKSPIAYLDYDGHYRYNYRYIDIPVRLDYYFSRKKIAPFLTTGISTNIFINSSTKFYPIGAPERSSYGNSNYSVVNLQYQFGGGIDIALKNSRLRIFPVYRISIFKPNLGINYTADSYYIHNLSARLYSIGLGFSYMIRL